MGGPDGLDSGVPFVDGSGAEVNMRAMGSQVSYRVITSEERGQKISGLGFQD